MEDMLTEAFQTLSTAIQGMNTARTPPPLPFKGSGNINDFFRVYENYCKSLYQEEQSNYLLALPSFLEGEAKAIVAAFGTGDNVTYPLVKQKLIDVYQKKSLGSSPHVALWSATRHKGETLTCYGIRLEALVAKINTTEAERNQIVKAKFMASLDPTLARQLSIRFGDEADTKLGKLVSLASILEDSRPKNNINAASPWPVADVDFTPEPLEDPAEDFIQIGAIGGGQPGTRPVYKNTSGYGGQAITGNPGQGNSAAPMFQNKPGAPGAQAPVCFGCGEVGHIKPNCPKETGVPKCGNCKKKGHKTQDCRTRSRNGNRGNSSQANCTFCGKGPHILKQCNEFKAMFLSCSWCGSSEHKSHLCPTKPSGN